MGCSINPLRVKKLLAPAAQSKEKEPAQEETILDCHFLCKGNQVIVKPRSFKRGAENINDYVSEIAAGLTQFVTGLNSQPTAPEPKETEAISQAA